MFIPSTSCPLPMGSHAAVVPMAAKQEMDVLLAKNLQTMKFISLQPFVPSGEDFEGSKRLFQELGFTANWDSGD